MCKNFPKILEPLQNSRLQADDKSKFCTDDPQILGTTVSNLVDMVTRRLVFVHPCFYLNGSNMCIGVCVCMCVALINEKYRRDKTLSLESACVESGLPFLV